MLQRRSETRADLPNVYAMDVDFSYRTDKKSRHNLFNKNQQYHVRDDLDLLASAMVDEIRISKSNIIASYDIILAPIHRNIHWTLCVVRINEKVIKFYDSMPMKRSEKMWANALLNKNHKELFSHEMDGWILEIEINGSQQISEFDCGIFVMNTAYLISSDLRLEYTQADSVYLRRRILWEVCKQNFFGDHIAQFQPVVRRG